MTRDEATRQLAKQVVDRFRRMIDYAEANRGLAPQDVAHAILSAALQAAADRVPAAMLAAILRGMADTIDGRGGAGEAGELPRPN